MELRRTLFASGVAALAAGPALGQMPESYRQTQLSALENQRRAVLAMVDSMPERLYRDKVTPVQRDFARQVEHVAGTFPFALSRFMNATPPQLPDTAQYLNSRAELRGYVNACFDWAAGVLRNQTAAARDVIVNLFGTRVPRWQVWDELNQHTWWTLGQMVANFRKHGMAPPGFGFF
jgi:hypothetical protein